MRNLICTITAALLLIPPHALTSQGLIIYTMKGCSRCEFSVNFFNTNNVQYTELSTSDDSSNSEMWNKIRQSGKWKGGTIKMPVIIKDGEVFFSIENLEEFLENIIK